MKLHLKMSYLKTTAIVLFKTDIFHNTFDLCSNITDIMGAGVCYDLKGALVNIFQFLLIQVMWKMM